MAGDIGYNWPESPSGYIRIAHLKKSTGEAGAVSTHHSSDLKITNLPQRVDVQRNVNCNLKIFMDLQLQVNNAVL